MKDEKNMKDVKFTIGTDAEVMLEKDGKLISAIPILPPAEEGGEKLPHGSVFFDNVLAEFTVKPSGDPDEFAQRIEENLKAIESMMAPKGITYRVAASALYPAKELDHPKAQEFGCAPDFDAYKMAINKPSVSAGKTRLRSAGAHVHIGHPAFEGDGMALIPEMIKLMDLFIGVPSVIMDNSPASKERKKLYGKAGAHRPKDYGPEYRTISNFWITSPKLIGWVYEQSKRCLGLLLDGKRVDDFGVAVEEIQRVINEGDTNAAKKICEKVGAKVEV